jgi:hypothetical protein
MDNWMRAAGRAEAATISLQAKKENVKGVCRTGNVLVSFVFTGHMKANTLLRRGRQ